MSRDLKPKRTPAKKKSRGGTLVGLFIGLVCGIVGAAAVVWYINKMPTPFNKQVTQPAPNGKPPAAGAQTNAAGNTPAPLPGKPGDPVPEKRFQFYDILPGKAEAKPDPAAKPEQKDGKPEGKEKEKESALKDPVFLQAGSFQNADDADNHKAKLALLGLEASIQQVMLQDKVWYRVRLGPYLKIDDVNRVRSELARQGIDVAVARKD